MTENPARRLRSGELANVDAVLQVRQSETTHGRAVDIRVIDGIDLRLLPDRGLDIGSAWFGGKPLAWVSQVGETGPLLHLDDMAWSGAFGGGLLATCGLRNVGMPSEGHGLHGTFSHLPADDVTIAVDAEGAAVTVTGRIIDDAPPAPLVVRRAVTTSASGGRVEVIDRTTNTGDAPAPAPLLYHLNFGYPLWHGAARLDIAAVTTTPRDRDSQRSLASWDHPAPIEAGPERVLEHTVEPIEGWGAAIIRNSDLGLGLTVRWRMAELPRLHQWIDPNPGMAVLGLEPANCSTAGRAPDRAAGRLPTLEPDESRETRLIIEAGTL